MKNGFIYEIINVILNSLKYLNLVEFFKLIGSKLSPTSSSIETSIKYSRVSTDIFIVFKWSLVVIFIVFDLQNIWLTLIVWYLLITNLYTYFYYHIWSYKILTDINYDIDRIKRRFINLFLAILFSIIGFAYLYFLPYSNNFSWHNDCPNFYNSLIFSLSNSFANNYDLVTPSTDIGHNLSIIQLLIMFIFITIIISTSVPQIKTQNQGD